MNERATPPPISDKTFASSVIEYELGEMGLARTVELFQYIVDNALYLHLEGHYGRTAQHLLNIGLINPPQSTR
jgi:hypothetical protein